MNQKKNQVLSISIVIVSYNLKEDLKKNLLYLLTSKAFKNEYEIIVVDNNSNDGSREYLLEMKIKFPELKLVLNNENKGAAEGRNIGWEIAQNELILSIDHDAFIKVEDIRKIPKYFNDFPEAGILGFKIIHLVTGIFQNPHGDLICEIGNFHGAGFAFRREIYTKYGGMDEHLIYGGDELDFSIKIFSHGWKILYIPQVVVLHNSIVRDSKEEIFRASGYLYGNIRLLYKYFPKRMAFRNGIRYFILGSRNWISNFGIRSFNQMFQTYIKARKNGLDNKYKINWETITYYNDPLLRPEFGNVPLHSKLIGKIKQLIIREYKWQLGKNNYSNLSKETYALIKWQNRDKLFLPIVNGKLLKRGFDIHKSPSKKGRVFHMILKSYFNFKILKLFSLLTFEEPYGFDDFKWRKWIEIALQNIGVNEGWSAFFYPNNLDKRFTSLLIDTQYQARGFAKVALDNKTKIFFQNEARALKYFSNNKPKEFNIPKLIYEGEFEGNYYLIQTVIPFVTHYYTNINDIKWRNIITDIQGNSKIQKSLSCQLWWTNLKTSGNAPMSLLTFLKERERETIDLCNAHGDFSPTNIRYNENSFYVFDWEGFDELAPIMTDYFTYTIECFIGLNFTTHRQIASRSIKYLQNNFESADKFNLSVALAYMSTRRSWTVNDKLYNVLCDKLLRK